MQNENYRLYRAVVMAKKTPEQLIKQREYDVRISQELADNFLAKRLSDRSGIGIKDIPIPLIELARAQFQLKRRIRKRSTRFNKIMGLLEE
jgi:hypothetical protein